jgi:hypothetical protein
LALPATTTTSFKIFLGLLEPYPTCWKKKWLSLEWDALCHQAVGELKSKVSSPPVLKFAEFDKPFEVYTGASILHWRSVDASWMVISYKSMKLNGCQRRRPSHRHSTSLGDVATLVGVAQEQSVHEQCVLKVLWDTCAKERQAIAVAQYIGAYEGGFDPQSGHNNMVRNTLSEREEFQAMNTIQFLVANVCR